jgi:hypothetical protein
MARNRTLSNVGEGSCSTFPGEPPTLRKLINSFLGSEHEWFSRALSSVTLIKPLLDSHEGSKDVGALRDSHEGSKGACACQYSQSPYQMYLNSRSSARPCFNVHDMTRIACCQDWSSWQVSRKTTEPQIRSLQVDQRPGSSRTHRGFHSQDISNSLRVYHFVTPVTRDRKPVSHVYESVFQPDDLAAYQTASSCWVCSFALI